MSLDLTIAMVNFNNIKTYCRLKKAPQKIRAKAITVSELSSSLSSDDKSEDGMIHVYCNHVGCSYLQR